MTTAHAALPVREAVPPAPALPAAARLADEVHAALRRSIVHGDYRPSERLVEVDIAEQLGASRTPIREALQRLATEGLTVRGRHGWVVREFTLAEIREIYQVRAALEGYAARTAAAAGSAGSDLTALIDDHHALLESSPIPRMSVVDINDRFHDALVAAAGNRRLAELVGANRTYYFNFRLAARYTQEQTVKALADHVAIAEAVLAGDGSGADELARRHVDFAMTLIEQYGDYRR